ncbi:hypothetical protein V498_03381, partial [Pseudogymnoascus sp. VKM F-4517 (FW-2822)]
RSTLKRLSSGEEALDKAYDDAIKRIEAQQEGCSELAKRVLTWISYAERPLTIEELRHALSVNPGDTDLDRDNFEDMEDIVSFCAGLVTVDDKSNIVRLIHYTTQEYFLRIRQGWNPTAQQDITITCLTYLSFDPFKTAISNDNTTNATGVHITAKLGLKYLLEMILTELDEVGRAEAKDFNGRTPLSWAAQHGQVATVKILVERNDVNADLRDNKGQTPLSWAARHGHAAIVQLLAERDDLLAERDDVDADSKDYLGQTPLSWAARNGHVAIVKLLTERNDVDADSKDNDGRTPLSWAAEYDEKETAALLAGRDDVNADSKDNGGRTPLSWAAQNSAREIVTLLAGRDDVNADSKDNDGRTPLSWAAECQSWLKKSWVASLSQGTTAKRLMEREDVEVNSKDNKGLTPLMRAANHGFIVNIEAFLEKENVDVNLRDNDGHTALWWAEQSLNYRGVEILKSKISLIERDEYDGSTKNP